MNILEKVFSGLYDGSDLTPEEVEYTCNWIVHTIFDKGLGNQEFVMAWRMEDKRVENFKTSMYLSLVYACCAALQDNLKSDIDNNLYRSYLKLSISLLEFIARHQSFSIHDGSVVVWLRKGSALQMMKDYAQAIKIYDAGIDIIRKQLSWKPGTLAPMESILGTKFSNVEILLSEKGNCYLKLNDQNSAFKCYEEVLNSIRVRGHEDFINTTFPTGLKSFIRGLKNFTNPRQG
jgi:tetratricopeptide (TPR) repeat protein